jgi:hypothetical protein
VFLVDDSYEGDGQEEGYVSTQSKYKLKFSPDEARALLFWNYHANSNQPETAAWNSGLHRYFDDEQGAIILQISTRQRLARRMRHWRKSFLEHFCRIKTASIWTGSEPQEAHSAMASR